jgi:hypothetical protein
MNPYSLALFVHVVGALLLFVTLTVEGVALRQLRRAATAQEAKVGTAMLRLNRVVGPFSAVAVLVPGLYMTATSWGPTAWIVVALMSWAVIALLGAVNGIRILALERNLGSESAQSVAQLRDPRFFVSWLARVGIALGVVFLMTVKPGAFVAVLAVIVAAAAGLAAGVALSKRSGKGADGRYSREGQVA